MDKSRVPLEMKKVMANTAQDITRHAEWPTESQPLLTASHTPAEFLQILMDNGHNHDAVIFLAHALPTGEAVWWACVCARSHLDDSDEHYQRALTTAETWVRKPTEENRRKAEQYAEQGNDDTPARWAAAAAFWSGDNIAPADEPAMEPPACLHAKGVSAAIVMSAQFGMPTTEEVAERYQNYLQQGLIIANGDHDPWQ